MSTRKQPTKILPTGHTKTPKEYFNRELSWLAFNRRVLEQAQTKEYPLLERIRYLAFVSSNLDEFFEIRVAGLLQQQESRSQEVGPDGMSVDQQMKSIHLEVCRQVEDQFKCWQNEIAPELESNKIHFKEKHNFTPSEKKYLNDYFHREIFPILTPLAIDPAHPFPQLINKALNILVQLKGPSDHTTSPDRLAIIPVPRILPRIISLPTAHKGARVFTMLTDVLGFFANELFPGFKVKGTWAFRITRNSDMYIDEEETQSLINKIEEELMRIKRGAAVRLEIHSGVNEEALQNLVNTSGIPESFIYKINGPLNLFRMMSLYDIIDRPDLKFKPHIPYTPPSLLRADNLFNTISKRDYLLHHPYQSFTPVVDFIRQAGEDPQVFAIKQTLYRTGGESPIVNALMRASENGKQVTVLVELKARFDEANNIQWAKQMEENGIHVVYGLVGLKAHCKACLVIRNESSGLRRYAHLGTGNYNSQTAKTYTDFSFFTAREDITEEVANLFNTLTGYALDPKFNRLLVSPFNLHERMQELILTEAENARKGKPSRIIAKMNSILDQTTIDNLYYASNCGVKIDLIVRGICALVPGVKDMSENITVRSILGRYLEHSRFFYFQNAEAEPLLYFGSADWMPRNFYRRIETIIPIDDASIRSYFIQTIIPTYLSDNKFVTFLSKDGSYKYAKPSSRETLFSTQEYFIKEAEEKKYYLEPAITAVQLD